MRPHRFADKAGNPIEGVRPSFKMHPDQHALAVHLAKQSGQTLTDFMLEAVDAAIEAKKKGKKRK